MGMLDFNRRTFVQSGAILIGTLPLSWINAGSRSSEKPFRVGLVTDLHYADKPATGTRHYRRTPEKLAEAATVFSECEVNMIVELGDLIDAADSVDQELEYLRHIDQQFADICSDRHYVLGNHCVHTLHKHEFLDAIGQDKSFYSVDRGGVHWIVLDSCFRSDGDPYGRQNFEWTDPNIPEDELLWLQEDLSANSLPVIVLAHQRLDVDNHYGVKNAAAVRRKLEKSGQVVAVFQGHNHINDLQTVGGIHYCTLTAMVEGSAEEDNGYSVLEIDSDGSLRLTGFRRQVSQELSPVTQEAP